MTLETSLLHSGFLRSSEVSPDNPAVEVDGRVLTYSELRQEACRYAETLEQHSVEDEPPLTAVFAHRSEVAFAGVLAALFRGHGYVPLNPNFPEDRTKLMLERSGCHAIVVDRRSAPQLQSILGAATSRYVLLVADVEEPLELRDSLPVQTVIGRRELASGASFEPRSASPDSIAYLLFTSGSTGSPKGVMVAHRSGAHYVETMAARYGLEPTDRCSQNFDLTFDASVQDLFLTWSSGACLCCPSDRVLLKPGRFIRDKRLTVWCCVPSTALFMKRFKELQPGLYPNLKLSLFCGEALPAETAAAWAEAAPNSVLENLYGPTEATVTSTAYRWDQQRSPAECEQGLVPIGKPLRGMDLMIVDHDLSEIDPHEPGELLLAGPQLALGYWQDPERTAEAFITPPGKTERYYRTRDRVRQAGPDQSLVFLGRMDFQVKILGHRVELGEIEAALRGISGVEMVVALGWPESPSGADGIEAFLAADRCDTSILREELMRRLPAYMVPRHIHLLPEFPLNANGKVDRGALRKLLEE